MKEESREIKGEGQKQCAVFGSFEVIINVICI